jgi:hypothetical protein
MMQQQQPAITKQQYEQCLRSLKIAAKILFGDKPVKLHDAISSA